MVTIKDIAKHAGVSVSTVSHVLNDRDDISETTKEKVRASIKELDYRPNRLAIGLRNKRTDSIGIIVENVTDAFIAEFIRGVGDEANKRNLSVFLCDNRQSPELGAKHIDTLVSRGVEGILYLSSSGMTEVLRDQMMQKYRKNIPIICMWKEDDTPIPKIYFDSEKGMKNVLDYLVALGHTKIGYLGGYPNYWVTAKSYKGFREYLEGKGLFREEYARFGDFSIEKSIELGKDLMSMADRPTAIVSATDYSAIGLVNAAAQMNIKVPDEISIMGFSATPITKYLNPPLTTYEFPSYERGRLAVSKLAEYIANSKMEFEVIEMPGAIRMGGTCGPVKSE